MADTLRNLPDRYLIDTLVPPLVANLDTRGLMMALLGGWQDRISDLRSTADRFSQLLDPTPAPYTCVLVTYRAEPGGNTVPVTLDLTSDTPEDAEDLPAWAAEQLEIEESRIVSAVVGTDALREVGIDTIQYYAASIGAVLYPGLPGESAAVVRARQEQAMALYFPRLKLKGTPESFSIFARLAGFDEGSLTPLWTRLSPREPGNLGAVANNADFRARPDFLPSGQLPDPDGVYNPQAFTDGPFYTWSSGSLTTDPEDSTYYPTMVNGRNPFISLVAGGEVEHPPLGIYQLVGGAPGRKAHIELAEGTDTSNMTAWALTEGDAFNGMRIEVSGAGTWRELTIEAQLATLKYRSSYYDMALYREEAGTRAITGNPDLMADPDLTDDGTATAPYRPWSGGTSAVQEVVLWPSRSATITSATVAPRVQASGTVTEIDVDELVGDAQRVYDLSAEVRAATRFPRNAGVGLIFRDEWQLAAYPCVAVLGVIPSAGSYGGILGDSYRPLGDYEAAFEFAGSPLTAQSVDAGTYTFGAEGVTGSYLTDSGQWQLTATGDAVAFGTLVGTWSGPSTDVVRVEPSNAAKAAGTVCYTQAPEGTFFGDGTEYASWDDIPWLRPLLAGGEPVNTDLFVPFNDPNPVPQATQTARVMDKSGVANQALVYDLVDVPEPPYFRLQTEPESPPITVAMAGSGTNVYPVVAVSSTTIVAEAVWNKDRYDDAVLWWPLSEQSAQPLAPVPAMGPAPDSVWLHPGDRVWDAERGWVLRMTSGGTVGATLNLPDQYTFAVTAKTVDNGTVTSLEPEVRVGAAELYFTLSDVTLRVYGAEQTASITLAFTPGANALVYAFIGTGSSILGVGDPTGWQDESSAVLTVTPGWDGARLARGVVTTQLHDFMVWDGFREQAQLDVLRAPTLVAAGTEYERSYVQGVSSDRWALEILPSGWVVPTAADAAPETYPAGAVRRYEGTGAFAGNAAYKQVGLGGADTLPDTWYLGTQGPALPATGRIVAAGTWSEPGINVAWAGSYGTIYQVEAPYGASGGTVGVTMTTSGTWPPALPHYNGATDRLYVKGDTGQAYEVTLDDLGFGAELVANLPLQPRPQVQQVVSDFETAVQSENYRLSVGTEWNVYEVAEVSAFATPPAYLYLTSRVKCAANDAFLRWVNPTSYGQALDIAARESAGLLEFENSETLPEGFYRLSIDAGNIGPVDSQFDGYKLSVALVTGEGEPISFPMTLLPGWVLPGALDPLASDWTEEASAADQTWNSVAYGEGLFVAVSETLTDNVVMTSRDGVIWVPRASAGNYGWKSICYGEGLFVTVARTSGTGRIMTSPNGLDWTLRTGAHDKIYSVTWGAGLFVAVGGLTTGTVQTSPDGITWTSRTPATFEVHHSIAYGNGVFVVVANTGNGNRVETSPDGITWTARVSAADNNWTGVAFGKGMFVAVAASGTGNRVMTSPDGVNWTSRSSAADNDWRSVAFGGSGFVAVADSGTDRVMTSLDGVNWVSQSAANALSWTGIGFGINFFVAVASTGNGNRVMISNPAAVEVPRGWTSVEFTLPYDVTGAWRLELDWTNDRDVPSRGEYRRLAVYEYTLRRIASELHRVSVDPLTVEVVDVAAPPLAAGAYTAVYNSYGTIVDYEHEQNIYPVTEGEDTFNNLRSPLANTLTGSTLGRSEHLSVDAPWVMPDEEVPSAPFAGTLGITPVEALYNIGDVIDLANTGAVGSGELRRVWQLWTAGTFTTLGATLGGITINSGGTWPINLEVVDSLGRNDSVSTVIVVNEPPTVQLATASVTAAAAPYRTQLIAAVEDPEGSVIAAEWYRLADQNGTLTSIGYGTVVPNYLVEETQQVRIYAWDTSGGTNFADVYLAADANAAPVVTLSAPVPTKLKYWNQADGMTPPPVQSLEIAALASDPEGRQLSMSWTFWDGGTAIGDVQRLTYFGNGTLCGVQQRIGVTSNLVSEDDYDILLPDSAGRKAYSLTVTDSDGNSTEAVGSVDFVKNQVPVISKLTVSNTAVPAGQTVRYAASAYDPDGDALSYTWTFPALALTLSGPDVAIYTGGLAGRSLGGQLTVDDGYGGIVVADVPSVSVYEGGLEALVIDPAGGLFSEGVLATITSPDLPDTRISVRYTLDGIDPVVATDGLPYMGPVMLPYVAGQSVQFTARAFWSGTGTEAMAPSDLAAALYQFTE